jgi:hypothetical protein
LIRLALGKRDGVSVLERASTKCALWHSDVGFGTNELIAVPFVGGFDSGIHIYRRLNQNITMENNLEWHIVEPRLRLLINE